MVDLCSLDGYHSGGGSRARSSSTRTCSASCARKHMAGASAPLPQPSCSSITPGRRTWPHGDNLELRPRGQRLCHSTSASCAGLARAAWSIADAHMATLRSPFPLGSEQPKQLRSTSETGITRHDGDDGASLLEWEHGPAVAFQASRRPLADSHKRMSTFPAVCCLLH